MLELAASKADSDQLVGCLDAHQHFWDPRRVALPWLKPEHGPIAGAFLPPDLEPVLARAGIAGTILVQGACSHEDTEFMLAHAARHEWIRGVVAWVELDRPAAAEARLDELLATGVVRGIRHLIHDESDPHWILRPRVRESLALVEERGLVLELPAVWPRHLTDVPALAERFPSLRLVVDHLGKPPLDGDLSAWADALRLAAEHEHVHAKFSGVDARVLEPALAIALEAYGPERLMWGSDWPVCLLTTTYAEYHAASLRAVERLAPEQADALFGANAGRLYAVEPVADYARGGTRGAH